MPYAAWAYARKNTNIAEVAHFKDNNAVGRRLTLFSVILGYVLSFPFRVYASYRYRLG